MRCHWGQEDTARLAPVIPLIRPEKFPRSMRHENAPESGPVVSVFQRATKRCHLTTRFLRPIFKLETQRDGAVDVLAPVAELF